MGPTRLRLGKPVIAAIEGPAVAGGLELALWCDLRVAAADATLGVYCRRFGVPLIDLGTVRLPRLIGHSRATDLILTGRGVDGVEAERIGLVNRVVAPGQALAAALTLAAELAALPQLCMRNDRLSALEQWDLSEDDAMRNEVVARSRDDRQRRDARRRGAVRVRCRPSRRPSHLTAEASVGDGTARLTAVDAPAGIIPTYECTFDIDLGEGWFIGTGGFGNRVVGAVGGGTVTGPRLNGTLVGPGADWALLGGDGYGRVDVRMQIRTHDGAIVYVQYVGLLEMNERSSAAMVDRSAGDDVRRPVLRHDAAHGVRRRALRLGEHDGVRGPWPVHAVGRALRGVPGLMSPTRRSPSTPWPTRRRRCVPRCAARCTAGRCRSPSP